MSKKSNSHKGEDKILPPHHIQKELCTTRPLYRQGRKLTAVKVYTINNESPHILIYRVPKINLSNELHALCSKYGLIKNFEKLKNYKTEIFTECYHVQYDRIQSSRIAKRLIDNKSFYGEILHVCYAPELESLQETKNKLIQREKDVSSRLESGPSLLEYANVSVESQKNRKKKRPAIPITEKRLKAESNQNVWKGIPVEIDPRIKEIENRKIGFKKHFQLPENKPKNIEYGPYFEPNYSKFNNVEESTSTNTLEPKDKKTQTNLIPTNVIKKYDTTNKRIVFHKK